MCPGVVVAALGSGVLAADIGELVLDISVRTRSEVENG